MKKLRKSIVSLLLAVAMVISFSACQNNNGQDNKEKEVTGTYEGKAKGYMGDVVAKVDIEKGKIKDIKVEAKEETPTIGGQAVKDLSKQMVENQTTKVDTVAGATLSSKALIEAVNQALKEAGIDPESLKEAEDKQEKVDLDQEADIVVVGAGGAGLTSAIVAAQEGKSVIVLEKAAVTGGNTSRATGGMNASETHYQKEQKIEDSAEVFAKDTMKGGHDLNNPELVKILTENSDEAIDWLDSIDAKLSNVGMAGGATNMRQHRPVDEEGKIVSVGTYLVEKLSKEAEKQGVKIIFNAKVNEILMDKDRVSGVKAETKDGDLTVKSKAVIVCSGGFGGSDELVSKYREDLKGYVSTNAPSIEGDAIGFLEKINANFIDMDQIQTHPTVVQKDGSLVSESLRGDGAILLNKEGKRFIDEMETRDTVSAAINKQTDKTAWLIVDSSMLKESKVIEKYEKQGLLTKADDYETIAKLIGADKAQIEKTMNDWASYIKEGEDKEFKHKNMDKIKFDLTDAPYYVGPVGPGIHHTMGGVEIDGKAQVINKDKKPITGLFAAGEVTGGVHGGNRLGGNAVSDIVIFGRIAGQSAAEYIGK